MSNNSTPGLRQRRFAAYLDSLALAASHADRAEPLKADCRGLLLPLERKGVESKAARLAPHDVRQTHRSPPRLVAASPWDAAAVLAAVRRHARTAMTAKSPVAAWIVDDTGFPKMGKQENCRVAPSLSVATPEKSLPVAWRPYLLESWAGDRKRRRKTGVPAEIGLATKHKIALEQICQALAAGIAAGVALADAACGNDSVSREELEELGLEYAAGVQRSTTVWRGGEEPLPPEPYKATGRPLKLRRRNAASQPLTLKQLALELPRAAFRNLSWRAGTKQRLRSRFAALRVRPAHRDYERDKPHPQQLPPIEWPPTEAEPTHYWLANLPASTQLKDLVATTKQRWIIERDYQERKQELGLGQLPPCQHQ